MQFGTREFKVVQNKLDNWGRWSTLGSAGGRCGSAERYYREPRGAEDRFAKSAERPVDFSEAEEVEKAVSQVPSSSHRQLLLAIYVWRQNDFQILRTFKIGSRIELGQHEELAAKHVWIQLEGMQRTRELAALKKPRNNYP